jgi:hypothetical protein
MTRLQAHDATSPGRLPSEKVRSGLLRFIVSQKTPDPFFLPFSCPLKKRINQFKEAITRFEARINPAPLKG